MTGDPFYAGLEDAPAIEECAPGQRLSPVQIEHVRVCKWVAKPCGICGKPKTNKVHRKKNAEEGLPFCKFGRKLGCATCGKPKNSPDHIGAPESFNLFASGSWEAYQTAKQRWHAVLDPLLRASGLPRGLAYVLAEGECSFGDDRERDQDNHRVVLAKALGDVLVEGGWLPKDKWGQYEFGGLQLREEGVNRVRLTLFPRAPEPPAQDVLL